LLSSWKVSFDPVDVEASQTALQELKRLGVTGPPVVVIDERVFQGWNPKQLAGLLGVEYAEPEHLSPTDLLELLDRILESSQQAMKQFPDERLNITIPGRNRTVGDLGYHIFRLILGFCNKVEQNNFTKTLPNKGIVPEVNNSHEIALLGEKARENLKSISQTASFEFNRMRYIESSSTFEYLERTVWHAAQHLRQLYILLESINITPISPMGDKDFEGLPLPKEIW